VDTSEELTIYNTKTAEVSPNNVIPGFYYWETITLSWKPIEGSTSIGWGLTGNAETNPITNFLETTDNNDLIFKRFNTQSNNYKNVA
jgi:hypothetical protein